MHDTLEDRRHGLARLDTELCPLSQPQVRSDSARRLLPADGHVHPAYNPQAWRPVIAYEPQGRRPHAGRRRAGRAGRDGASQRRARSPDRRLARTARRACRPRREKLLEAKLAALPEAIRADVKQAVETATDKRSEVQKYLAGKFAGNLKITPQDVRAALAPKNRRRRASLTRKLPLASRGGGSGERFKPCSTSARCQPRICSFAAARRRREPKCRRGSCGSCPAVRVMPRPRSLRQWPKPAADVWR